MTHMTHMTALLLVGAVGVATVAATGAEVPSPQVSPVTAAVKPIIDERRPIDLAICLDTSGSMDGLIESAKQKLWAIVNDLALAEPAPSLRVALLTYGNDGHAAENGWVHVDSAFTEDLDVVSQHLFAMSTNGGTELVGRVLDKAAALEWRPSADALKLVVVAGNESADQDRDKPYRDVCRSLISQGVMINAIYCGPEADAIAPGWRDIALLADGQFACIDHDKGTVVIETPFDAELSTLSAELNTTYIPLGAVGESCWINQSEQDGNAASLNSAAAASRAQTKAQGLYVCSWDLIDACKTGTVQLEDVKVEDLPEPMQKMTADERAAHVALLASRRGAIQEKVQDIARQRDVFIREEMARQSVDGEQSFDAALRRAIRAQATSRGFKFFDDGPAPKTDGALTDEDGC